MAYIETYISDYIKSKGYKSSVIANKTGITQDALSRIINGKRKIKADEFVLLCDTLEIDPNIFKNRGVETTTNQKIQG